MSINRLEWILLNGNEIVDGVYLNSAKQMEESAEQTCRQMNLDHPTGEFSEYPYWVTEPDNEENCYTGITCDADLEQWLSPV